MIQEMADKTIGKAINLNEEVVDATTSEDPEPASIASSAASEAVEGKGKATKRFRKTASKVARAAAKAVRNGKGKRGGHH